MGLINKIVIDCSGSVSQYIINLADTDDIGINAILATIPESLGVYEYSSIMNGDSVTSSLNYPSSNGCVATLFKDNIGYTYNAGCCFSLNIDEEYFKIQKQYFGALSSGYTITLGAPQKKILSVTRNGLEVIPSYDYNISDTDDAVIVFSNPFSGSEYVIVTYLM